MRLRELEPIQILPEIGKWLGLSILVAALVGSGVALFVFGLRWVTVTREAHPWLIAFLPLAGFGMGWVYHRFGKSVESGNNLLLDEIHDPKAVIPLRMAPLILVATWVTHLFGGSAGREGTAVQMGGSLADQLTWTFRLKPEDRRVILMAGMSAGFAAVFGTPIAGAIFGLEVLAIGRLRTDAILPCFLSAILANEFSIGLGVHHTLLVVSGGETGFPVLGPVTVFAAVFAGALFGLTGMAFARATHGVSHIFEERVKYPPFRPLIGGVIVAVAVWAIGTTRYIGLGDSVIEEAFTRAVHPWDFLSKLLFTSMTLGSGFKGGEVTPLFYIGATLGNALSSILPLPLPLLTAMGFAAVFAGAANVPIACTIMAVEFFGTGPALYVGIACVMSYLFSGHAGIYHSQRIEIRKVRV